MQAMKLELTVIKISIVLACLVMGAGLTQRFLEGTTQPKTQKPGISQTAAVPANEPTPEDQTSVGGDNPQVKPVLLSGKVVAIGDSYTFGYPYGTEFSWVKLAGQNLGREFINKGKTSQTSKDVLNRFKGDVLDIKPESVLVMVGTGDALRGVSLTTYQENIQEMVKMAKDQSINVIIGLPLPYPDTGTKQLIYTYRSWLVTYAQNEKIKLIDFEVDLIDQSGALRKDYTDDGKYPNKAGYAAMATVVEKNL